MNQKLKITDADLKKKGLNQAEIHKRLKVSRETVSKWFKGKNFPRPAKLLQLGQLLEMSYDELVSSEIDEAEPVVAFRSVRNKEMPADEFQRAKEMGYALEKLVPFLPFDTIRQYKKLETPKLDSKYIIAAVKSIKDELKLKDDFIDEKDIIRCFTEYKTTLIPVLLGEKKEHENALHIFLPESGTNWVYINLDTYAFDFKFWLIHEFGHVLTPSLRNNEAEHFANKFAQEFLYPHEMTISLHSVLAEISVEEEKLKIIIEEAQKLKINPYTISKQLNSYFSSEFPKEDIVRHFDYFEKNVKSDLKSTQLFGSEKPNVEAYIKTVEDKFNTIFFDLLRIYIKLNQDSYQFLRVVLNLPITDVKEINNFLRAEQPNKNPA